MAARRPARSNAALVDRAARTPPRPEGLALDAVQLLPATTGTTVTHLIQARGLVDVVIPRGGAGLIDAVVRDATVPTIETGVGNCHVYVHSAADLDVAETHSAELEDAPTECVQRRRIAVDRRGHRRAVRCRALSSSALHRTPGVTVHASTPSEDDCEAEFLSMDIALRGGRRPDAAILHVNEYGTGHTEAIVTTNLAAAQRLHRRSGRRGGPW